MNIFNQHKIDTLLEEIIEKKHIEDEVISKWLYSNCKNYLLKNQNKKEITIDDLSLKEKNIVINKNLNPPFLEILLDENIINKIEHITDYLKDYRKNNQNDLTRLSFKDDSIKASQWIEDLNKHTSDVDDVENLKKLCVIEHEGKKYTWYNLQSKKSFEYEAKKMANCLTSKWNEQAPDGQHTNFYTLRDENNESIMTLNLEVNAHSKNHENNFFQNCQYNKIYPDEKKYKKIIETSLQLEKEKDSTIEISKLQKNLEFFSEKSQGFTALYFLSEYNYPDIKDFCLINIVEAKTK